MLGEKISDKYVWKARILLREMQESKVVESMSYSNKLRNSRKLITRQWRPGGNFSAGVITSRSACAVL